MGLTKLAIKFAAPFPKVESFERYLFLGPHPDDIEIGAGATVAALAAQGKTICFLICTDGTNLVAYVGALIVVLKIQKQTFDYGMVFVFSSGSKFFK